VKRTERRLRMDRGEAEKDPLATFTLSLDSPRTPTRIPALVKVTTGRSVNLDGRKLYDSWKESRPSDKRRVRARVRVRRRAQYFEQATV